VSRIIENWEKTPYTISPDQIELFRTQGFIHLKKIFSEDLIGYFKGYVEDHISAPTDKYQTGFNRVKYDIFDRDAIFTALCNSSKFGGILCDLAQMNLLHTQSLGFELEKNKSIGFPWHIGTQSFGFQQWEQFGCTLWTPLVEVNNQKQGGGMAYVPKDKVSGDFMYKNVDPSVFSLVETMIEKGEDISLEEFVELRDGPLNQPAMKRILDFYAVIDDFEIGDSLLFDKFVIHKSVKLLEGEIDSRAALAMRFVDLESRYDQNRAQALEIPRKYFNYQGPTQFHLMVADQDEALLRDSMLYKGKAERFLYRQENLNYAMQKTPEQNV